jgi:hypothetical protein
MTADGGREIPQDEAVMLLVARLGSREQLHPVSLATQAAPIPGSIGRRPQRSLARR